MNTDQHFVDEIMEKINCFLPCILILHAFLFLFSQKAFVSNHGIPSNFGTDSKVIWALHFTYPDLSLFLNLGCCFMKCHPTCLLIPHCWICSRFLEQHLHWSWLVGHHGILEGAVALRVSDVDLGPVLDQALQHLRVKENMIELYFQSDQVSAAKGDIKFLDFLSGTKLGNNARKNGYFSF